MKILETHFTELGWTFEQVSRIGNISLYKRSKEDSLSPHFEVVRVKSHNGFTVPGSDENGVQKVTPPAEYYPNSKSWGIDGFTFTSRERNKADKRIIAMIEEDRISSLQVAQLTEPRKRGRPRKLITV